MRARVSTPTGPRLASSSVSVVKPEMSANRTTASNSSLTGEAMGEASWIERFWINFGTKLASN